MTTPVSATSPQPPFTATDPTTATASLAATATATASPTTGRPSRRWWALGALCLSVLLVGIDNTIVNVALPTIGRSLDASTSDLQWVVDGYTLVFATLLLLAGHLGDRFGRRRMLITGLAIFALTSVAASFATSTGGLIAGRAAMGVGAALIFPATLALLVSLFPDRKERAAAIGIWSGVTGLSVALGPIGGGLLVEHFSWAAVFLVNVPLAVVAMIATRLLLAESRDPKPGRFDPLGAFGSMVGVGLLVWAIVEAPANGWGSAVTIGALVGAVAALGLFVWWEARRTDPLFDVTLFTNARFSAASAAIAAAFFGLFGFIFLITQYFQIVRGYGVLEAGVATLPFAVVIGSLSPVAIVLMKRFGTTAVVAAGLALMSSGFVLAAGSGVDSAYWGRIVVSMVLMAAGLALTSGPATEAIMGALPRARVGAGSAVNDTTREIGGTLGVAIVGSVMNSIYGSRLLDSLGGTSLTPEQVSAASRSVSAGFQAAALVPPTESASVVAATSQAFVDGLSAGSWVAAAATGLAAVGVLVFLPARHQES
jgi:MFS transporter, DHA2 family, multidrug resistance protein